MKKTHVVLDRDGTIIKHIHYLCDSSQVSILPTVHEGLKKLINNNIAISIHTNQSGVGRGYFSVEEAQECNNRMLKLLNLTTDSFKEICIAYESPDGIIENRKPSSKFGEYLLNKYSCSVDDLFYIGDTYTDYQTSVNIGCKFIGVNTGLVKFSSLPEDKQDMILFKDNFLSAIDVLLASL